MIFHLRTTKMLTLLRNVCFVLNLFPQRCDPCEEGGEPWLGRLQGPEGVGLALERAEGDGVPGGV